MNASEVKELQEFLIQQRCDILNKTYEFLTEQSEDKENVSDEAEVANKDSNLEMSIHLHERDRILLLKIDQALAKMSSGNYGHCVSCGNSIDKKRLKARPFADLCIECKEEQEDSRKSLLF